VGYSLYVTRAREITREEWRDLVARDPELRLDPSLGDDMAVWSGPSEHEVPWIGWSDGRLESKYPDPPLIEKLVAIAAALGAQVQGDDGETYCAGGRVEPPRGPSLLERARGWLASLRAKAPDAIDPASLPFRVGDRVRDPWDRRGTVVRIDVHAHHGLGEIEVRFDTGLVQRQAAVAHGFERVPA
jgi:hypothetical protein